MKDSLVLGFNHNGINCIQNTAAERSCDKVWFTEAQISEWSGMSKTTLWRRLNKLEEVGRITSVSDLKQTPIPDSLGVMHESTIYNLNVLNQLAMVELDCPVLNETAKKFSDILSEVETTGSYNSNAFPIPTTFEDALILAGQQMKLAKEQERLRLQAEAARDEARRTKAHFVEGRDAELSGRVGGLTRSNNNLRALNGVLKQDWYSVKDVVNILFQRELTTYAVSTCKAKVSKALKDITGQMGISTYEEKTLVEGVERVKPFYHRDCVERLIAKIEDNPSFLKAY